jgi:hypothetical protein
MAARARRSDVHDYLAPAWLPFGDEPAAIESVLGRPLTDGPEGWNGAGADDDLLVWTVPAQDDGGAARAALGFAVNVTIVFTDVSPARPQERALRPILAAVASLAAVDGARLALFDEVTDDSLVLRLDHGRLALNRLWDGWARWPALLDAVPAPHRLEELRFGRR